MVSRVITDVMVSTNTTNPHTEFPIWNQWFSNIVDAHYHNVYHSLFNFPNKDYIQEGLIGFLF